MMYIIEYNYGQHSELLPDFKNAIGNFYNSITFHKFTRSVLNELPALYAIRNISLYR